MSIRNWLVVYSITLLTACGGGSGGSSGGDSSHQINETFPTSADSAENGAGDNSIETATPLPLGQLQTRTIFPVGDVDFVSIELTEGTIYELSANNLCATCDTYLYLYDVNGDQITSADDYMFLDSRIEFSPSETGTYYLEARAYNETFGISTYSLNARELIDFDEDGYSSFYDCNDNDASIHPSYGNEVLGDGIDQNCSGFDYPDGSLADNAEEDDSFEEATSMIQATNSVWEIQFSNELASNVRTIEAPGEADYFSISIPAYSAIILGMFDNNLNVELQAYDSDGITLIFSSPVGAGGGTTFPNSSNTEKTIYVKYSSNTDDIGYYIPFYYDLGTDADGDGYYTQDWDQYRDCNDTNSNINGYADEIFDDGIDNNCDGVIDTISP
ncbi:hypothetical protein A9Q81_24015 [Gammaproteobacteria bacterium 42_54_T18]|nr:hypothetical protein A9Q81_24015 [Gammaproteobacteria bacterium 42_54_T18]